MVVQVPPERDTHSAVVLGGQMVAFGGNRGGKYLNDVWSYSLADNAWVLIIFISVELFPPHAP